MPLTDSQVEDIERWIRSHALMFQCACCGAKEWVIQRELSFALTIEPQGGRINYLGGYPMVVITCKNCGYTVLFNAIQMGMMESS